MTDVAELGIKVSYSDVTAASKGLGGLGEKARGAETATGGLTSSFKKLIAPLAASVSLMAGFNKLTTISRQFDKFNASLITATGSAKNAEIAFGAIEKFASTTPYTLDQSVEAFTKLVNLGLTPSERALKSYGDTASAMGKDMTQLVEAVADATTGEFERLKEFGIKTKSQGDNVSFTFRGITTTVKKNAEEIEEYLMRLGENNFAGAMSERMKTLDGAIANLQDQWDGLFRTISQQGSNDAMTKIVRRTTAELKNLQDFIASGGLQKTIELLSSKFKGWGKDAKESIDIVGESLEGMFNFMGTKGPEVSNKLTDAFKNFPENVRAFIRIGVVELLSFFDKIVARSTWLKEQVKNIFSESGREAADKALTERLKLIDSVRQDSINTIIQERETAVNNSNLQIQKIKELTTEYKELQLAKQAAANDELAQFKVGGAANIDQGGKLSEEKRNKIVEGLLLEEFAAQDHAERMQKIEQDKFKTLLNEQTQYTAAQKRVILQLAKFEKQTQQQRAKTAIGALTEVTGAFAGESRKAFEVNKQLRTAQAVVDGIGAVQSAYAWGSATGGVIGGVAAAGAAALFTAAQVRQIQSQEFGGGGSPQSVSVTPAAPYTSDTQAAQTPTIEQPIGGSSNLADAPVNSGTVINLFDQSSGVSVEQQERSNPDGSKEIDFIIRDRVDDFLNAGEFDESLALNYGLQRAGRGR